MGTSNSQIAKNTTFLYIRMLVVMIVTLYTSRVILSVLGIDNYGIYNLVGGIVVLFTFLSAAMTTATQRYLCVAISDNTGHTQQIFSSSLIAHILLIILLLVLAETVGLWFVKTQLVIPAGREYATHVTYQLSVSTAVISVYRIPFTSAILAYEKMSFYAWNGVVEVFLKLFILWPLTIISADKLILYCIFILLVNVVITAWQGYYTHTKLENMKHRPRCATRKGVKEIFGFAAWSSFSAIANIGSKQGLNIMVNLFLGVAINAAVGVMNQVSNTVYQFIQNFMAALNPPLIKEYTVGNFEGVRRLLVNSSKFSFYLILLLITPIVFNIDKILAVWLTEIPPYTGAFCVLALISLIPNTVGGPIWTIMQASGRIQRYQLIISGIILLNLPCYYIILKFGVPVYYTLGIQFITNLVVVFIGASMSMKIIGMNMSGFIKEIILPGYLTLIACWLAVWGLANIWPEAARISIPILCCKIVCELAVTFLFVWFVGLRKTERFTLKKLVVQKVLKRG